MRELLKQKVAQTKREIVLDAVSKLFEKEGLAKLKMQDIAKALGISVGALYKLFASKEELFLAYVSYQIELFYKHLLERTHNIADPKECLHIYTELKFSLFSQKRKALEDPLMGDPLYLLKMGRAQYRLVEPIHRQLAFWFERLDAATPLKERDFLHLAYLFHAFTNGYVEYWLLHGGSLEERSDEVVELFLEGVRR